jgi:hypothetical protein
VILLSLENKDYYHSKVLDLLILGEKSTFNRQASEEALQITVGYLHNYLLS